MAHSNRNSAESLVQDVLDVRSTLGADALDESFDIDMDADGGASAARYVVERELGRGGLSVVYEAAQSDESRRVAIKVPFPHLTDKSALRSRFAREARITAAVSHPNIVCIHDTGVLPDGRPYIVTELVPGESLEQRLERGPLSARDTLFVGEQLLAAVGALGREGIVHRDIKPSNIMVDGDERALTSLKLLDLGIAQRVHDSEREPPMAQGPAAGTPMYMAPEQLNGLAVDARTDVYACGAVLYECVFGLQDDGQRDVRSARRQMRISRLSLSGDASPRHSYPRALLRVIGRALDSQRKKRFANGEAMHDALVKVRRASERSPVRRALVPMSIAAALGIAALAVRTNYAPSTPTTPHSASTAAVVPPAADEPAAVAPSAAERAEANPNPPTRAVESAPAPIAIEPTVQASPPALEAPSSAVNPAPVASAPLAPPPTQEAPGAPEAPAANNVGAAAESAQTLAAQTTARRVIRAREALAARDFRAARKHAQSALSVDVRDPEAQGIAIRAALALREYNDARQLLARYTQWHPDARDLAALKAELAAAR